MILFHKDDENYNWLGTFSNHPVTIDSIIWSTAEHYYQAQRFIYFPDLFNQVKACSDLDELYWMVHEFASLTEKRWNTERLVVMEKVMRQKFEQHPELKKKLLETNNETLVSTDNNNIFWGVGLDGKGQNRLGKLLMALRSEYQNNLLYAV